MTKDIKHTWYFAHAPEVVWQYLTDAALLSQWLMPNDILPVVGHQFRFTAKPVPQIDFDGNVYCEVLEVEPLHKLVYSWKGGPAEGQVTLDTIVHWTLQPKDDGTELTLSQTGFKHPENAGAYASMDKGWGDHILNRLKTLLNGNAHEPAQN